VQKGSRKLERAHSLTEEGEHLNSFVTCMGKFFKAYWDFKLRSPMLNLQTLRASEWLLNKIMNNDEIDEMFTIQAKGSLNPQLCVSEK